MSDNERSGLQDDELSLPKGSCYETPRLILTLTAMFVFFFLKATVQKLINEMMPSDLVCAKDTRDLLIDGCVGKLEAAVWVIVPVKLTRECARFSFLWRVEFIHLIASEANDICEKENKKTIAGEHIISALQTLGFEEYVEDVDEVFKEHKKQQKATITFMDGAFLWEDSG